MELWIVEFSSLRTQNSPAAKIPQGRISILKGAGGSDDEGAASPCVLGKEDADVSRYQILPQLEISPSSGNIKHTQGINSFPGVALP